MDTLYMFPLYYLVENTILNHRLANPYRLPPAVYLIIPAPWKTYEISDGLGLTSGREIGFL